MAHLKEGEVIIIPPCDRRCDDAPPRIRRSREFDPHNPPEPRHKPDPRPQLPCTSVGCCACRPQPLGKKPMNPNLKLRQLADCYACRVSEGCHNRRKVFYERWQTFLDRMPRMPNTDYNIYECNSYVDLGINNDFFKHDSYLGLRKGPRTQSLENFLWMKNLAKVNYDIKSYACPPHEPYSQYCPPMRKDSIGLAYDKRHKLYHEDAITRWREIMSQPEPKGYVQGATIYNCRPKPFRKDASFTNPVDAFTGFSSGNEPPLKQIRDIKLNL